LLPAGAFAGWDLHPLESAALSRRTPTPVIAPTSVRRTGPIGPVVDRPYPTLIFAARTTFYPLLGLLRDDVSEIDWRAWKPTPPWSASIASDRKVLH
jgi:hypothetical protein